VDRTRTHLSQLPFATDQRSLLLAVDAFVGLLYERVATSESPYICTPDGTLSGLHLDHVIAGMQSHGVGRDAVANSLGSQATEADLLHNIVESLRLIADVSPLRHGEADGHSSLARN
jgi:hypothetical protein